LQTTYNDYKKTHSHTDSDYNSLSTQNTNLQAWLDGNKTLLTQTQIWLAENKTLLSQTETWLNGNITYYNTQVTNLQNQLSKFTLPMLGFSSLTAIDNRTNPNNTFLQVNGTIHNFGIDGTYAYQYAKAYHDDGSVALDTLEIPIQNGLFSIHGQSLINVDLNIYYNGSALASWTIGVFEVYSN